MPVQRLRWLVIISGGGLRVRMHTGERAWHLGSSIRFHAYSSLPIQRIPEFMLGVGLGIAFLRSDGRETHPLRAYSSFLVMLVVLSLPIGQWVSLVMVPFAVLVYELAEGGNGIARFLSTGVMTLPGGASNSVYLLQFPVGSWIRVLFLHAPGELKRLGSPLTPLILVFFSILVFRFWEEPSRKLLRQWFAGIKQRRAKDRPTEASAKDS